MGWDWDRDRAGNGLGSSGSGAGIGTGTGIGLGAGREWGWERDWNGTKIGAAPSAAPAPQQRGEPGGRGGPGQSRVPAKAGHVMGPGAPTAPAGQGGGVERENAQPGWGFAPILLKGRVFLSRPSAVTFFNRKCINFSEFLFSECLFLFLLYFGFFLLISLYLPL